MKKILFSLLATTLLVSACSNNQQPTTTAVAASNTEIPAYNGKIVFIRLDSLQAKYGMFIDLNAEFQKKQTQAQAELESRARKLQNEINSFQQKVQNGQVTEYQARAIQEDLQKKDNEFQNYSNKVANDLAQEQVVISNQLTQELQDFLTEYNQIHQYSMILQTAGNAPVAIADPVLDITDDVLAELNKRYEEKLASKK